jgi:uncharacterized membrane protein
MGDLTGSRTVEIDAPLQRCFDIAADIEHAPEWQTTMRRVNVLERDGDGRALLAETEWDAKVKTISTTLRFSYAAPARIDSVQTKGDVKSLRASWSFEALDGGRTRATYSLATDPGRLLSMLLRGPAEAKVRDHLLGEAAEGLKRRAETAG